MDLATKKRDIQPMTEELVVSKTVMVVDDLAPVRKMIGDFLESLGMRVLEASSGCEAVWVASLYSGTIHLLLTDVEMPGMSGW